MIAKRRNCLAAFWNSSEFSNIQRLTSVPHQGQNLIPVTATNPCCGFPCDAKFTLARDCNWKNRSWSWTIGIIDSPRSPACRRRPSKAEQHTRRGVTFPSSITYLRVLATESQSLSYTCGYTPSGKKNALTVHVIIYISYYYSDQLKRRPYSEQISTTRLLGHYTSHHHRIVRKDMRHLLCAWNLTFAPFREC